MFKYWCKRKTNWVRNVAWKWPNFVHMGRGMGVCLNRVIHGQVTRLYVTCSFQRVASQAVTRPNTRPGTRACGAT